MKKTNLLVLRLLLVVVVPGAAVVLGPAVHFRGEHALAAPGVLGADLAGVEVHGEVLGRPLELRMVLVLVVKVVVRLLMLMMVLRLLKMVRLLLLGVEAAAAVAASTGGGVHLVLGAGVPPPSVPRVRTIQELRFEELKKIFFQ